jgi:hypothetical protein
MERSSELLRDALTAADFHAVFLGVPLILLLSTPFFLRIPPDAGAEVSGHAPAR